MQRQGKTFLTLHTALFTPCTSHFTLALRTRHFISSQIMWPLLTSSQLFSSHPISFHMSSKQVLLNCFPSHLSTDQLFSSPRSSSQLIIAVLHARKLLLSERSLLHKKPLGAASFWRQTLETQMHLDRKDFPKYFVLQSLHKALPSTTTCTTKLAQSTAQYYYYLCYKACTKHFPVLLCTTKLARSTSQYYFVPQSLHEALPSTTLYYKACKKHFPVLRLVLQSLHKALPSTTLYYKACLKHFPVLLLVLQSLHKTLPSTTVYYKACTKHVPVLLLVLQSLHKALPSTTLYYKACLKHFPVLLCTTKLAQSTSQYYLYYKACTKHFPVLPCTAQSTSKYYFVLQSLHKALPSTTLYYKACTKALPSTTLYYKACTKHFPVVLCTTKLA